jgi:DNA-binding NarL/FixJ family response regulator
MSLRCVIVDDNREVLESAANMLRRQGVDVVGVALTGNDARALVDAERPDVVLVDIVLGAESGLELARDLCERDQEPRCQTILISTHEEADFAELIAASPALGFLPKSKLSATAIREILDSAPN